MSFAQLDDNAPNNPKIEPLSVHAKWLWVCGLCYANRNLTDGALNKKAVKVVTIEAGAGRRHIDELHHAGLWDRTGDGYLIHDYPDWNRSREKVLQDRAAAKERMRRIRSGERSGERNGERSGERSPTSSSVTLSSPLKDLKTLGDEIAKQTKISSNERNPGGTR